MKKIFIFVAGMMWFASAWADTDFSLLLNKVSFPLKVEKWVTTKTAEVIVGVNAAVSDAGIEKIQGQVLGQLMQLSALGEWHIVRYMRQQDKSGLESIQIIAQSRLPQSELNGLRDKAKAISKPGNTYTIDNVAFTPSDDEITQANVQLREMIYQQAKMEIDAINKIYPEQKYYLHHIEFNSAPSIMPMAAMEMRSQVAVVTAAPLNVGNKMELNASVVIASMPDVITKKPLLIN